MQAIIERSPLNAALILAKRAAARKNAIPVLTCVKLAGGPDGVSIRTTDLDREIIVAVPGSADRDFAAVIPMHHFADMVKASSADMVALDTVGESVRLDFQGASATVQAHAVSDFPEFPGLEGDGVVRFSLMSDELADMLRRTSFAISTEETRYYLNGVYLHAIGDELRAAATDGHRLAKVTRVLPAGAGGMPGVIIPRATVADVLALIGKRKPPVAVHMAMTPQRIEFRCGMVTIISKTIDGTFPDYQRVIPTGNNKVAGFNRADLAAAVKRVSAMSSEKGKAVRIDIDQHATTAVLSVNNPDAGTVSERVPCDPGMTLFDAGIVIGFNADYVLDILSAMAGPRVLLAMAEAGSPAVFSDPADASAAFVIMPMRV